MLVGGGSFAVVQFLTASYIGPELPDITSAIVSLMRSPGSSKVWQPKRIFRFDTAESTTSQTTGTKAPAQPNPKPVPQRWVTAGAIVRPGRPSSSLTAMVTLWRPPSQALFAAGGPLASTIINIPVPMLDKLVAKDAPVVAQATPYGAVYTFNWLAATGTAILIAAILTIAFALLPARPWPRWARRCASWSSPSTPSAWCWPLPS